MVLTKQTKFILAIVSQLIIILFIVIFKASILSSGIEVMLKVAPIDPRDMLRGDYITFQYDISNIDIRNFYLSDLEINNGETVYVILGKYGKYWTVSGIQKKKPSGENIIFIKGIVSRSRGSSLHIIYGIEDYFIPEGKGASFNFWNARDEVFTKVVVNKSGNAVLKEFYVNDKSWGVK